MRPGLSVILLLAFLLHGCSRSGDRTQIPSVDVEVDTPSSLQTGEVVIRYRLIDRRIPARVAGVRIFYSMDKEKFLPATGGEILTTTTVYSRTPQPSATHCFLWDSMADTGTCIGEVTIRIEREDAGTGLMFRRGETQPFPLLNAEPAITLESRVFDPKLPGADSMDVHVQVSPPGIDYDVAMRIVDAATASPVRHLSGASKLPGGKPEKVAWDGKDDLGRFVDAGDYRIVVEAGYEALPVWTHEETVHVVRLGVAGLRFLDNGLNGTEYQLMFHRRNKALYAYYAIPDNRPEWAIGPDGGEVSDLDLNTGAPRPAPVPWQDLNSPPQDPGDPAGVEDDTYNLPVCYDRASTPRIQLTLGSSSASCITPIRACGCNYPLSGFPIRVIMSNGFPATPGENENLSPGGKVDFICLSPLPDEVKKNLLGFSFTFEYRDGDAWHPIPGSSSTEHTVYTLFDRPKLTTSPTPLPPDLPWVSMVDLVCGWIDGPATAEDVCEAVTRNVNTYFGLRYGGVTNPYSRMNDFRLSEFIEDYNNKTFRNIYCLDCAFLVSAFAKTAGVDHENVILSSGIQLNYMILIGKYWMIPYTYFAWHAVVSRDGGTTLSDACCTLDNDGFPGSPPHQAILPVNMPYDYYKTLLSKNPGNYGISEFRTYLVR